MLVVVLLLDAARVAVAASPDCLHAIITITQQVARRQAQRVSMQWYSIYVRRIALQTQAVVFVVSLPVSFSLPRSQQ